jgi:NTP pyrophosphatase (non-canonical NTP hydrolase)
MISDETTTMSELKSRISRFAAEREWEQYHNPKDLAISVVLEAAELMENFQWVREEELSQIIQDREKLARIREELADVLIYCLRLSQVLHIDLAQCVLSKMEQNESKYPVAKVKGRYRKYTEITGQKGPKPEKN